MPSWCTQAAQSIHMCWQTCPLSRSCTSSSAICNLLGEGFEKDSSAMHAWPLGIVWPVSQDNVSPGLTSWVFENFSRWLLILHGVTCRWVWAWPWHARSARRMTDNLFRKCLSFNRLFINSIGTWSRTCDPAWRRNHCEDPFFYQICVI